MACGTPAAKTRPACCKATVKAAAMVAIRTRVKRDSRRLFRRATSSHQLTAAIVVPSMSPLSNRYFWNVRAPWTNSVKNAALTTEIKAARVVASTVLSFAGRCRPWDNQAIVWSGFERGTLIATPG
jgi:Flp pilus assembly protein TadG